jgi:hypothetical protein
MRKLAVLLVCVALLALVAAPSVFAKLGGGPGVPTAVEPNGDDLPPGPIPNGQIGICGEGNGGGGNPE